jgi:hypothetical protein
MTRAIASMNPVVPTAAPHAVRLVPTLKQMEAIYHLSRDGGAQSERFRAYLRLVPDVQALAAYNPMAGPPALDAVQTLLALDAEQRACQCAAEVQREADDRGPLTVIVVLLSRGMWTDRLATELQMRAGGNREPRTMTVAFWSREPIALADVERESRAEAVRAIRAAHCGPPRTVRELLACEGLAGAIAGPSGGELTEDATTRIRNAADVLGDSASMADMVGVLYGDEALAAMGWPTLDLPNRGGFRWAADRAAERIGRVGLAAAIREGAATII